MNMVGKTMKVSVVAGIYFPPEINLRRFLDACLAQTLDEVEFILLLDGPNDTRSRQIISEYKEKFDINKNKFILIENEQNLGIEGVCKKGITLSKGEYIIVVDSDDFFDDNWTECMYNYINSHKNIEILAPRILVGYLGEPDVLYSLLGNDDPSDTGLMFKKEILDKYNDFVLNLTTVGQLEEFAKVEVLPLLAGSFYYYIRTNENSTSITRVLEGKEEERSIDFKLCENITKTEIKNALEKLIKKEIDINSYSKSQLIELAMPYCNLDKNTPVFSYEDLQKI